jgi:hypothetical protein
MRKFTIEQYERMSKHFNEMTFRAKIKTIIDNKDILTLASDHNWWGVKAKDKDIQDKLIDSENEFDIEKEWDANEMMDLIDLLGIDNVDI